MAALEKYLGRLEMCEDVRSMNASHFQLERYYGYTDSTALIEELYIRPQQHL